MTEFARRTISELLARYELEPELKDVFVEGIFDQEVIMSYFRGANHIDRMAYEINSVEVPSELLMKHGLTEGNKQRVIALARELSILPTECSYRCLVDKDLDHWFGTLEATPRLNWTEFSSIELNFFSDEILQAILVTTAKAKIVSWKKYNDSLIEILSGLYVLRLADRELSLSLDWLPITKCLSHKNNQIIFDFSRYIDRLLMKNKKNNLRGQFKTSVAEWTKKLSGDYRNHIRGHNFVELLAWSVHSFQGIKEFSSQVAIQRLFVLFASREINLESAIE